MIQRSLWKRPALQTSEAVLLPALPRMKAAEPVYSDGGDTIYVMDQVGETGSEENWISSIQFRDTVSKLSDREKRILSLRFFQAVGIGADPYLHRKTENGWPARRTGRFSRW